MSTDSVDLLETLSGDPDFVAIKRHVIAATGLTYYTDRDADLAQQVGERLVTLGLTSWSAYLELLESATEGEAELDLLIGGLTIGETYFFRHSELFDALENTVLSDLLERNRQKRQLRVWSAGCSVGAEAYSVAILLQRTFGQRVRNWDISIVGTDINRQFLTKARSGRFDEWMFRSAPPWLKPEFFTPQGKVWQIAPELSKWVSFQYHNLARHPFPSLIHNLYAFDLILCRNVMIYCDPQLNRQIVAGCRKCLVDGGWLLVGHAEAEVGLFRQFQQVLAPGAILYQKKAEFEPMATLAAPAIGSSATSKTVSGGSGRGDSRLHIAARKPECGPPQPGLARHPLSRAKVAGNSRPSPATVAGLDEVVLMMNHGELTVAAARCHDLLRAQRLNPAVNFFLALIVEQFGDLEEAEQRLRQAIYLDRDFVLAHYYLGLMLLRKKQSRRAQRSFANVQHLLLGKSRDELLPPTHDLSVANLIDLIRFHLDGTEEV